MCRAVLFDLNSKTSNRRGTQFHTEKGSNLILSCHLDPIGDQNDVQYLSIFATILFIIGISGTVPTSLGKWPEVASDRQGNSGVLRPTAKNT